MKMTDPKTTHEALKQLTPREAEVLRERFGIVDDGEESISIPPSSSEEGGSGGVPAPAKPPS